MIRTGELAKDFRFGDLKGNSFMLSDLKGKKIMLSFFRNGACALCNLRIHELIRSFSELKDLIQILAIFESGKEDMLPFVGKQSPPFPLIPDPEAKIFDLYELESSPEKIKNSMNSEAVHEKIREAEQAGFPLRRQEGSNFDRLPAEFLIDENLVIRRVLYSELVGDHFSIEEIRKWISEKS
ncbi:redoxin [Leptospira fluminis]|uniref:Redoxin n=1 Tax=Leptospira fluminis TaxID=2484979 RepID=A0A4R9GP88_9LEPT|nr:redoxin domain-containing protein [Leptospira fluminis]TGK17930.1 redoxin [Leptospira fluminis]